MLLASNSFVFINCIVYVIEIHLNNSSLYKYITEHKIKTSKNVLFYWHLFRLCNTQYLSLNLVHIHWVNKWKYQKPLWNRLKICDFAIVSLRKFYCDCKITFEFSVFEPFHLLIFFFLLVIFSIFLSEITATAVCISFFGPKMFLRLCFYTIV